VRGGEGGGGDKVGRGREGRGGEGREVGEKGRGRSSPNVRGSLPLHQTMPEPLSGP